MEEFMTFYNHFYGYYLHQWSCHNRSPSSMAFCVLADGLKATYYVSCFAWAEDMIEEVVCPSPTSLPFDLSFFDMLQRKDKVNTFGIKEVEKGRIN